MDNAKGENLKASFDRSIKLEFHGVKVTSDGGLLSYRDLDDALGLFNSVPTVFSDSRLGRNVQHDMSILLRQSIYSRLAGVNDDSWYKCLCLSDLPARLRSGGDEKTLITSGIIVILRRNMLKK